MERETETQNYVQAVQASETRYRRLFETAQDGILILNAETGEIDDVNPYMIDMLHYSREEFLGMKLWEVSPFKDKVFNQAAFEELQDKKYIRYKDLPLETKEGKPIAVEFVSNVYKANGDMVIQCNIRNITERKETEEKFKQQTHAMEASMDGIAILNEDQKYVYINKAHARIYGYDTVEELIGQSWRVLYDEDELQRFDHVIMPEFSQKREWRGEGTGKKKDGSAFFQEVSLTAMDNGGLVCIVHDITDRKLTEDEREKMLSWQEGVNLLEQSLLAPSKLDEKLRAITDCIVSLFDVDFSRIWLIQPGDLCEQGCIHAGVHEGPHKCLYHDRCLHLLASSGRYTHTDGTIHRRVPFGCYKIGRIASDDDHKFLTNNVRNDSRIHDHEWARKLGLVSFAGYQLRVPGGMTMGVLALFAAHPISPQEDSILDGLSSAAALVIQRDIAEKSLRESEEKHRLLFDSAGDAIFIHDTQVRILAVNPLACKQLGYTHEELMSMTIDQVDSPEEAPHAPDRIAQLMEHGHLTFETVHQRKDGSLVPTDVSSQRITWDGQPAMMSICRDITSRKLVEEELKQTMGKLRKGEETLSAAINATKESLVMIDRQGIILLSNTIAAERMGKSVPELLGTCLYDHFLEDVARTRKEWFDKVFDTGKPVHFEDMRVGRDFELYVYPVFDGNNEISRLAIFAQEITDRKQAEDALRKSQEKYRSIFENVIEGIFQTVPEGRFISVNPAMARIHGFASPEEMVAGITDIGKQLYSDPEIRKKYVKILKEKGKIDNFEAQVHRKDGGIIWTSVNARAVKDAAGNILRFEGTSGDITERKQAEEELITSTQKLRKSLAGTIQVVSMMLETRDPYTGGHQGRVSTLARSIAQEMGLPNDTVDIIRMAGTIHDIGKMSVPAEILSKPGRLSDIEMSLLKVHPQTGYDILKVVDLPSPIAEIVLQHHERLDGSGYPKGLKDGEILLEAQIMSVADVVEAMASHRPYRPGLGIDSALEEIEKNKGILYDAGVVDVCLKLFREKGFSFELTGS